MTTNERECLKLYEPTIEPNVSNQEHSKSNKDLVVLVRMPFATPVLPGVRLNSRLQPKVQCPPLPVQLLSSAGGAHSLHTLPQPVGTGGPVWNATGTGATLLALPHSNQL